MNTKKILIGMLVLVAFNVELLCNNQSQIKIFDKETLEKISYASVFISNINSNTPKRYRTNKNGELSLTLSDKSVVKISLSGYKTISDTVKVGESKDYLLEKDIFNLDQIVVTATRTDKTLSDAPIITQVITNAEITKQGLSDIKDLLGQEVPGIEFLDNGPMGIQVNLQGLTAKNILFLVDGERIAGEKSDNIDYSRLNVNNIDRIEIIRGAASALYGSQAMGGVINIITKEVNDNYDISISGNYSEMNEVNYKELSKDDNLYNYKKHLDKLNLNLTASAGFKISNITTLTDISYQSVDAYQLYDSKGGERYYPEYDTTIYLAKSASPMSVDGFETINIGEKLNYETGDLKLQGNIRYFMLNKYDFTKDNVYEKDIDYSYGAKLLYKDLQVILAADNYYRYSQSEKTDNNRLIYRNDIYNPKIIYNYNNITNHLLTGGVEFLYENLYADRFTYSVYENRSQWNATLFLQDDWKINDKLNTILGIRIDEHKEYSLNISPKASIKYDLDPITLRLNYAAGYRSPTLKELYMNWDHQGMFQIVGSTDLLPETNNYLSLSAEYVSSILYLTATGYSNWFNNKIDGIWENNETIYQYGNIGRTTLAGVEGMAKLKIISGLFLNTCVDYLILQQNKQIASNIISPINLSARLEYNYQTTNYQLTCSFSGTYKSGKEYSVIDSLYVNDVAQETYYNMNIDGYFIARLAVSQVFFDNFRLTLGIKNVFDYKAPIVSFNSTTTIGRRFYANLQYNLRG
jgi:outer membrane receptor for ferrienterochelin and colicins